MKNIGNIYFHVENNCFVNGDIYGNDLNECRDKTKTPEKCQELCEETSGCVQFTWLDRTFADGSRYKECCMKDRVSDDYLPTSGAISGPKQCGN